MDTISREPSPSYLPIAGLIAGLVGLLLGAIALANASKANKAAGNALIASEAASGQSGSQVARIEALESTVSTAAANADSALRNFTGLRSSTQENFNLVANELSKTNSEIAKLQEAATRTASAPRTGGTTAPTGPVVAGPGEYVVKSGDTGYRIATANGVTVADLQAVNPGVNWNRLNVGQKLKLPKK